MNITSLDDAVREFGFILRYIKLLIDLEMVSNMEYLDTYSEIRKKWIEKLI